MPDIALDDVFDDQPNNRAERCAAAHQEKRRRSRDEFPPYMERAEASEYFKEVWGLNVARATLAKAAVLGNGPRFHKFGRFPKYTPDDCDEYARAKLGPALRSTSEIAS
jgi:hypothetical protein